MPLAVFMARRHECQLVPDITQRRARQPFDDGFALAARALIVDHQKMGLRAEADFEPLAPGDLNDLGAHPVPGRGATLDDLRRKNLDSRLRANMQQRTRRRANRLR